MHKKTLKFFKWFLVSLLVVCISFFVFYFKEIKMVDAMLRPPEKSFGSGLLKFNKYNQLMWAIWAQDKDKIDYLIKEKGYNPAEIRVYTEYGSSNLMRVYILGSGEGVNSDFVEFLISRGFNADDCENGNASSSPIFAAAIWGKSEIVEILLKNGAKINCQDGDTAVPLTVALQFKRCELAKYLVSKGASLDGVKSKVGFERKLKECDK